MDGGLVEWQSLVNENSRGQDTLMTMTVVVVVDAGWTNDETGSNRKKLSLVLVLRVLYYYYYCFAVHCRGYLWRIHPFQGQKDVEISFFS